MQEAIEEERRKKVAHGAWSKAKIGTKLGMHKREIHDEAEAARAIQLADELSKVAVEDRPRELLQIPLPAAVGALGAMSAQDRAVTIAAMTDEERRKILGGMSAEDRADAERVQEAIEEEARRVQAEKEAEARRIAAEIEAARIAAEEERKRIAKEGAQLSWRNLKIGTKFSSGMRSELDRLNEERAEEARLLEEERRLAEEARCCTGRLLVLGRWL